MKMKSASTATFVLACSVALACSGAHAPVESAATAEQPPEGRLPEGVRPTRYRLSLEVIPERDTFSGLAIVDIELAKPASRIWMHGRALEVMSIHAEHEDRRIEASWQQRTSDGVALVNLAEPLPAGKSSLHVQYAARLDSPLQGLYRVRSNGETYAFTQFESTNARMVFPSFDEPRFKTPFQITLTVPGDQIVASNTPVDRAVQLPNGTQRVAFMPTPPLPTYLVAFAVGPFDVVSGPDIAPSKGRPLPIPLRGIAAKGQGPLLQFALDHAGAFVQTLERYFEIPYPYRKLDLVAVPDFAAGAMENVGLITFREWLLLLDTRHATEGQRRAFAYVMAHELAHQWFGNLVTMPWWNDIWLNEAFATWMGDKVVEQMHPEYHSDLSSLASAQRAMDLDSLQSARSIRQPIESNHDIKNAFDAITYQKGGAVLSMFEHWMGEETFREGIQLYLRRHEWRTATSGDLLAALDEVSELDVSAPFRSFLTQPGVPLISVNQQGSSCESGPLRLELRQQRYLPIGSKGNDAQTWEIPFCFQHANGKTCGLLSEERGQIDLPGCPDWWMPNHEGAGYFRFELSPSAWAALRTQGWSKLSDRSTMAVADSVLGEFDRGVMALDTLTSWFPRFVASSARQVATAPMGALEFLMDEAASDGTRDAVRSYARKLYHRLYVKLGWRARKSDSSDIRLLREAVLRFMIMDVRDAEARSRAARLGRGYIGYRAEPHPGIVDPELAGLVLAAAVQEGNEGLFDYLVDRLVRSDDATIRNRILAALGHAEDPVLSARALDLALDPRLRMNEVTIVLGPQFRSPRTRRRAWQWLTDRFDALQSRLGASQVGYAPWFAASFCSDEAAAEVGHFFEARVRDLPGGPRNLASTLESIRLCAAKVENYRASVEQTFARR
jgi:alanyl aminopeptidase